MDQPAALSRPLHRKGSRQVDFVDTLLSQVMRETFAKQEGGSGMSDNTRSGRNAGFFARIRLFFLRQHLQMAARGSHGYKREAVDLLKRHPDVSSDVLVRDLGDKSQDSTYRI